MRWPKTSSGAVLPGLGHYEGIYERATFGSVRCASAYSSLMAALGCSAISLLRQSIMPPWGELLRRIDSQRSKSKAVAVSPYNPSPLSGAHLSKRRPEKASWCSGLTSRLSLHDVSLRDAKAVLLDAQGFILIYTRVKSGAAIACRCGRRYFT